MATGTGSSGTSFNPVGAAKPTEAAPISTTQTNPNAAPGTLPNEINTNVPISTTQNVTGAIIINPVTGKVIAGNAPVGSTVTTTPSAVSGGAPSSIVTSPQGQVIAAPGLSNVPSPNAPSPTQRPPVANTQEAQVAYQAQKNGLNYVPAVGSGGYLSLLKQFQQENFQGNNIDYSTFGSSVAPTIIFSDIPGLQNEFVGSYNINGYTVIFGGTLSSTATYQSKQAKLDDAVDIAYNAINNIQILPPPSGATTSAINVDLNQFGIPGATSVTGGGYTLKPPAVQTQTITLDDITGNSNVVFSMTGKPQTAPNPDVILVYNYVPATDSYALVGFQNTQGQTVSTLTIGNYNLAIGTNTNPYVETVPGTQTVNPNYGQPTIIAQQSGQPTITTPASAIAGANYAVQITNALANVKPGQTSIVVNGQTIPLSSSATAISPIVSAIEAKLTQASQGVGGVPGPASTALGSPSVIQTLLEGTIPLSASDLSKVPSYLRPFVSDISNARVDIYNFLLNQYIDLQLNERNPMSPASLIPTLANLLNSKYNNIPQDVATVANMENEMNVLVAEGYLPSDFPLIANFLIAVPTLVASYEAAPAIFLPNAARAGLGLAAFQTATNAFQGINNQYTGVGGNTAPSLTQGILGAGLTGFEVGGSLSAASQLLQPLITGWVSGISTWAPTLGGAATTAIPITIDPATQQAGALLVGQIGQSAFDLGTFFTVTTATQLIENGQVPTQQQLINAFEFGAVLGTIIPAGGALAEAISTPLEDAFGKAVAGTVGAATQLGTAGAGQALIGAATGSQLTPIENFLLGAGLPIAEEAYKSASGSLETAVRGPLAEVGAVPLQYVNYGTPLEQAMVETPQLVTPEVMRDILERGLKAKGYEIPAEIATMTPEELRSALTLNPALLEGAGQIFKTIYPPEPLARDIENGVVPELAVTQAIYRLGDVLYNDASQNGRDPVEAYRKLIGAVADYGGSRPFLSEFIRSYATDNPIGFLQTSGFTLGNSFAFNYDDIVKAFGIAAMTPTGAISQHVTPSPAIYETALNAGEVQVEPSRAVSRRGMFASGQSEYISGQGINTETGRPTVLQYNYGAFGEPIEPETIGAVGQRGKYYIESNPYRGNIPSPAHPETEADLLTREQVAQSMNYKYGDPEQQVQQIQTTRVISDQARNADFRYVVQAALQGKLITTPITYYLGEGELELAKPIGAISEAGERYDIVTVQANQGLFKNVPGLENIFPTFTRGAAQNIYQRPVTIDEFINVLKTTSNPAWRQNFEASTTQDIKDALQNNEPIRRYAVRGVIENPDKGVLLVHEVGRTFWSLPGGGVVEGTDPVSALVKEVGEETSILISKDQVQPILENQIGGVKTFRPSGADFYEDTNSYAVKSTAIPNVDNKEIDGYRYYKPGVPLNLDAGSIAILQKYYGDQGIDITQIKQAEYPEKVNKMVFDLDRTLVDDYGRLRPNVIPVLQALQDQGIDLALWTHSTADRAESIVKNTGLDKYFGATRDAPLFGNKLTPDRTFITREDYAINKPDITFKDIAKVGGDILVDNNQFVVDQTIGSGKYGYKISDYTGGSSTAMERLLNFVNAQNAGAIEATLPDTEKSTIVNEVKVEPEREIPGSKEYNPYEHTGDDDQRLYEYWGGVISPSESINRFTSISEVPYIEASYTPPRISSTHVPTSTEEYFTGVPSEHFAIYSQEAPYSISLTPKEEYTVTTTTNKKTTELPPPVAIIGPIEQQAQAEEAYQKSVTQQEARYKPSLIGISRTSPEAQAYFEQTYNPAIAGVEVRPVGAQAGAEIEQAFSPLTGQPASTQVQATTVAPTATPITPVATAQQVSVAPAQTGTTFLPLPRSDPLSAIEEQQIQNAYATSSPAYQKQITNALNVNYANQAAANAQAVQYYNELIAANPSAYANPATRAALWNSVVQNLYMVSSPELSNYEFGFVPGNLVSEIEEPGSANSEAAIEQLENQQQNQPATMYAAGQTQQPQAPPIGVSQRVPLPEREYG